MSTCVVFIVISFDILGIPYHLVLYIGQGQGKQDSL